MKISRLLNPFSFCIQTTERKLLVNHTDKNPENICVFLNEQEEDQKNLFHWAGEYEVKAVAISLQDIKGQNMIGKIFIERLRVVFFNDEGLTSSDNILQKIGNTDVLIFEKGEKGLSDNEIKKILEEIDPRAMITSGARTLELFKKMALPVIAKEEIVLSQETLPNDHTEYYSL